MISDENAPAAASGEGAKETTIHLQEEGSSLSTLVPTVGMIFALAYGHGFELDQADADRIHAELLELPGRFTADEYRTRAVLSAEDVHYRQAIPRAVAALEHDLPGPEGFTSKYGWELGPRDVITRTWLRKVGCCDELFDVQLEIVDRIENAAVVRGAPKLAVFTEPLDYSETCTLVDTLRLAADLLARIENAELEGER